MAVDKPRWDGGFAARGATLTEWNKNPENNALRIKRLRQFYTKTG